jgi:DNA-binding transcriptional ArsR family regulator
MNQETLSELLKAVSDSTRRSLLTLLCQPGKTRVTDLARVYDLSLNAISKHIKVLEKAGLVKRETMGRTHWIEADLTKTADIEEWFTSLKSIWALRLDCLNNLINEGKNKYE